MQRTNIEYLTHSWNPLAMRCTPVSEGCQNCWHIAMAKRHAANPHFTEDEQASYAGHNIVLREKELEAPLRLRKPARIGVQFMGDLFLEGVGYHWQEKIWDVMEQAKQHTFIVLTKRVEWMLDALDSLVVSHGVLPNVWAGCTIENQARADERMPFLLACRDMVAGLWVSVEPMLGPVDPMSTPYRGVERMTVDWIACGPETGPGARPMQLSWAYSIKRQCEEARVPFFFKSAGKNISIPDDLLVRQYPEGMVQ